jgi:hypothetical protein
MYSWQNIADALSILYNTKIELHEISKKEYINRLEQENIDNFRRLLRMGTLYDIYMKQYEIEDSDLENILGRPATSMPTYLKEVFKIK